MTSQNELYNKLPTWIVFFILIIPDFVISIGPISFIVGTFVYGLWLMVIIMILQRIVPPEINVNPGWFLIRLLFALSYMFYIEWVKGGELPSSLYVVHFLAVLSIFSCVIDAARFLVIAEEGRKQRFDKYIGTFLLFMFYPLGVWFLHPRIRRVAVLSRS